MNDPHSFKELHELLRSENLAYPQLDDIVRAEIPEISQFVAEVGLPSRFADWFECVQEIVLWPNAIGFAYTVNDVSKVIRRAVRVAVNEFGTFVIDCDTGCLVYLESSGTTQLVNTSVERFLYFVGHFSRSANENFADVGKLRRSLEAIDSSALADPEGVWSLMLEEAEAGLY